MSAFIELALKGGGRAMIEAGTIGGFIVAEGADLHTPGTPERPVRIILRAGETLDVIGQSASLILVRAAKTRKRVREEVLDILCDFLEPGGGDDDDGRDDVAEPVV